MRKIDIGVYVLAGIALIGLIVLLAIDKSVSVIVPVLTALIGMIAGRNQEMVLNVIGSIFKKKE